MNKTIRIDSSDNTNWQNAIDTGDLRWSGGSWKYYWKEYSGKEWPKLCCREGCTKEATDGAHIIRINSETVYIVPLCGDHNPRSVSPTKTNPCFSIKNGSVLVNADDDGID